MKICVIVTSYNYEQFIGRALESLVNQTYKDFDVIIIDDGSKDNSLNIIKNYIEKYPRFHLYTHENNENKGLVESLKLGISKTSSDYIAFLESDDYWQENYLQEKIDYIKQNNSTTILINDIKIEGKEEKYYDYIYWLANIYRKHNKNLFRIFYQDNAIATFSSVMIKTDVIKNLDFNTPIPAWLDWWLWRQVAIKYPISFVDNKLTIWNRHDNSYITVNEKENEKNRKTFIKKSNNLLLKECTAEYIIFKIKSIIRALVQNIFSVKNEYKNNIKRKVVTILGIKIKGSRYIFNYKIRDFIQGIFSITNIKKDNYVGKQIKILGIKFKFKNKYKTLLKIQDKNFHDCNNKISGKISRKIEIITSNINAKNFSNIKNALNYKEKKEYSGTAVLFKYDYFMGLNELEHHFGVNLGDYVQTIATKNIIHSILPDTNFVFWDRDNLMHYNNQKAYTIMQGWFSHSDTYLPNDNILPIFIGTHITTAKMHQFINLVKHNPGYFDNITFGCRDTSTLKFLNNIGQKCYLSRCLTLTFPKRQIKSTQNKVFIVDISNEYLQYIPSKLLQNAEFVNQRAVDTDKQSDFYINSEEQYLYKTQNLLNKYRDNASLVITSALHCASPCIAMGIPTILIDFEDKNDRFWVFTRYTQNLF